MLTLPRRAVVSTTEKVIGGGILLLLLLVGFGIFTKGKSYDPLLYTVDESSLEGTRTPIENKAGTLKEEVTVLESQKDELSGEYDSYDSYDSSEESDSSVSSGDGDSVLEQVDAFAGFSEMGESEYYSPDTLYEKINGRAPAYLGFNFQQLAFRTFSIDDQEGQYVDVFIYQMDTPVNAFGIFSLEREAGAQAVEFVSDGYRSEMGFFYRQANAYVQVIASDFSDAVMDETARFSEILATLIPADDTGVGAAAMLPSENQISGSLSYIQAYAYGLEQLNDVFEARYQIGELEFPFFGMKSDSDTLASAFEGVTAFFTDYGTVLETNEIAGAKVLVAESFGQFSIVFLTSDSIGGVMNADELDVPRLYVETFLKTLSEDL